MLFCHITTRIPGREHDGLLSQKGGSGFPYLVFMDAEGDVLGEPPGRSVQAFEGMAERAQRYLDLRRKSEKSSAEEAELFSLEVGFGRLTLDQARAKRARLALPPEHDARLAQVIRSVEASQAVEEASETLRQRGDLETKGPAIGERLYRDFLEKGAAPHDPRLRVSFHALIVEYGIQRKVLPAAEAAVAGLKQELGDDPRARDFLQELDARLERLRRDLGQ